MQGLYFPQSSWSPGLPQDMGTAVLWGRCFWWTGAEPCWVPGCRWWWGRPVFPRPATTSEPSVNAESPLRGRRRHKQWTFLSPILSFYSFWSDSLMLRGLQASKYSPDLSVNDVICCPLFHFHFSLLLLNVMVFLSLYYYCAWASAVKCTTC